MTVPHHQAAGTARPAPGSVTGLAAELLRSAAASSSGRAARTLFGASGSTLRQTVIALTAGAALADHDNPGEATLLVLEGRVRLTSATTSAEGSRGDLLVVPDARHRLDALADAAVLLTVAKLGAR